jgi:uncharacterized protein YndB with AHSA1/START domain
VAARPQSEPGNGNANEKELTITRVFDAPRDLVWKAWTDSSMLAQWWGPRGFTNPVCTLDLRPGGAIRIDMRAPDGVVYPMSGTFREIAPPERLVFVSTALDGAGKPMFEVMNTVMFAANGKKTTLTLHARAFNVTAEAAPYLSGMDEGWSQSLDCLADFLADNAAEQS